MNASAQTSSRVTLDKLLDMALAASTTHLGTAFEQRSLLILSRQFFMSLTRIGGKGDGGVDLRGWWTLPHHRLRVLAQCKAEKAKVGPRVVRELEGTGRVALASPTVGRDPLVSVLCSQSGFTPGAMLQANTSTLPMLLLHIERSRQGLKAWPDNSNNASAGNLLGAYWNEALIGGKGILGNDLEIRREHDSSSRPGDSDSMSFIIGLYCQGKRIRSSIEEEAGILESR